MTSLFIMLGLLVVPWLVAVGVVRAKGLRREQAERVRRLGGCLGLAALFGFTGVSHFILTAEMVEMLPAWLPARETAVYASGVLELMLAVLVLVPSARWAAGWTMLAILAFFLPVNVWAAMHHTGLGGHQWGPVYLWIRVPLQLVLAAWVWWFAVRAVKEEGQPQMNTDEHG